MDNSAALAMLAGGSSMERGAWGGAQCDELCEALRGRESLPTSSTMMELERRNTTGDTIFLLACKRGHVECMQLLAEAGCDTAATSSEGGTALMHAVSSCVPSAVLSVLAAGWCELEATDYGLGDTANLDACHRGHMECMRLLVEAGCNTAATSNDGRNALINATFSGIPSAVRTALEAGWCELEATNMDGDTAFLTPPYISTEEVTDC